MILLNSDPGFEKILIGALTGLFAVGVIYLFSKGKEKADKVFTNHKIEKNPNDINLFLKLGYKTLLNGEILKAIEYFSKANKIDKNNLVGIYFLGISYHFNKEFTKSRNLLIEINEIIDRSSEKDNKKFFKEFGHFLDEDNVFYFQGIFYYFSGHIYYLDGDIEKAKPKYFMAKSISQANEPLKELIESLNLYNIDLE
jgi:tetratricopeptide (TPR) repeat protein